VLFGVNVVVVVPAFDEAPRIGAVIRGVPPEVDRIVVVDDASSDGTGDVAYAADAVRTVVVRHAENRGVGAAIATGYAEAAHLVDDPRAAFVVMAGDGQMDPRDLPALVRPVAEGVADYVKGCRFDWPGARATMPLARWLGGWGFSVLTSHEVPVRPIYAGEVSRLRPGHLPNIARLVARAWVRRVSARTSP
jgi:glycosyltransferase involved in cell wall biosynthesis